ncbi:MAG: S1 RNA-binding domain-containing protein [Lachnospiraceae bacterium]|nr:S1 RNA-binding domain-containing protein [Lachnospiraceae bacterium]
MAEESMKDFEQEINNSVRKVYEGDIMTGTVIGISDDEVTLDLNYYAQGIIKAENLSNDPGFRATEQLSYGQKLSAKVIALDDGNGNLELSIKEADDDLAWEKLAKLKEDNQIINVKVREAVKGGLVAFAEGLRGFIPASQVSTSFVEDLSSYVGKDLPVIVRDINQNKKQVILSAKEVQLERERQEHDHKIAMLAPGEIVEGVVESIQSYGAFVDIGDGISGLIHISQLAAKRVNSVNEVLKEGQKVRAKIINTNDGKVSLSIRAIEEEEAPQRAKEEEEKVSKEIAEYSDKGEASTSLGDLLKGIKL